MALDPLYPGASWTPQLERVSGDAYVPSAARAILVLDSPSFPTPSIRSVKQFLPAGVSDPGVTAVGDAVRFTWSPAETALFAGYGGLWTASIFVGVAGGQYPLVPTTTELFQVVALTGGSVPHG